MIKDANPVIWMPSKYGVNWNPFKITVIMKNEVSGIDGQWKEATHDNCIAYEYEFINLNKEIHHHERAPKRNFFIQNPADYKGQLGASGSNVWANTERVFVVNGFVNKADGNFELDFRYQKIEDTGITIGSYPGSEQEAITLKNLGCNSLLDIQQFYRSVDVKTEQAWFKRQNFNYTVLSPVSDIADEEYARSAFEAALKLEELINKQGQHVFLHDFTSISRVPTVLMVYLSVMCRHHAWSDLQELLQFVKRLYAYATPNMRIVQKVLEQQKDYHQQCIARFEQDERDAAAE